MPSWFSLRYNYWLKIQEKMPLNPFISTFGPIINKYKLKYAYYYYHFRYPRRKTGNGCKGTEPCWQSSSAQHNLPRPPAITWTSLISSSCLLYRLPTLSLSLIFYLKKYFKSTTIFFMFLIHLTNDSFLSLQYFDLCTNYRTIEFLIALTTQ